MSASLAKTTFVVTFLILVSIGVTSVQADTGWVRNPSNPVLVPSTTGWDSGLVLTPRLYFDGSIYHMWYIGSNGNPWYYKAIGYATSNDGVAWMKSKANPVLSPGPAGSWDSDYVSSPSVIYNGSAYLMWYVGAKNSANATFYWFDYLGVQAFGLATSFDGITWTKYPGNPVMAGSEIDSFVMYHPWVLQVGNHFEMWYTCVRTNFHSLKICHADSPDGIHWTKNPTEVFTGSGGGSNWDSGNVYSPNVLYDGRVYGMWYSGFQGPGSKGGIGFATSPDGSAWTRAAGNPILSPGAQGSWDSKDTDHQGVVLVGGTYKLYYSGDSPTSPYQIGLAESPTGFALPEMASATLITTVALLLSFTVIAARRIRRPLQDE